MSNRESYYDVLKVKQGCSNKELKDSFIELSKEHHPDKHNNSPASNVKFAQLNEAYRVLSKDRTRQDYDEFLKCGEKTFHHYYGNVSSTRKTENNMSHGGFPKRHNHVVSKNLKFKVLTCCILFSFFAGAAQLIFIERAFRGKKQRHIQETQKLEAWQKNSVKKAAANGLKEQIRLLQEGLLGDDNDEVMNRKPKD